MTASKKVGFYTIGDAGLPSTWFRIVQYLEPLRKAGILAEHLGLSPTRGGRMRQLLGLLRQGIVRRWQLRNAASYDVLVIQKGLTPCRYRGLVEKLLGAGVPYLLDIDDAVYMPNPIRLPGPLARCQDQDEFAKLLRYARCVIAGNSILAEFAKSHGVPVKIIPTPIDTETYFPRPKQTNGKIVIGWSGSASTNILVNRVFPALNALARNKQPFTFLIISNHLTRIRLEELRGVDVQFLRWNKESEIEDLQKIDIGLMPLDETDEWSRAKCGLKALQYMALGQATVCSPVGVNTEIIQDGVNGYLARGQDEWVEKLSRLIENPTLRDQIGGRARKTVEERYSVRANVPKMIDVLEEALSPSVGVATP